MDPLSLYQLPDDILPKHYDLTLAPSADFTRLAGEVEILLEVHRNIIEFVLNAKDLKISEATAFYEGSRFPLTAQYHPREERVVLAASRMFEQGKTVVLRVVFSREIDDLLAGFYRCIGKAADGTPLPMASSQFEATDARRAFPCFDEPRMKATFSITARVPAGYTALSNMPVASREAGPEGFDTVVFARSPRMSTYLLHLSIGRWDRVSAVSAGVEIAVHVPEGRKEEGLFALDVAVRLLPWYNDYFGIPYPLPKLDLIAIPDFAAGAMENWGAMTFRETALLSPPSSASARNLQRVAIVVAHEMAHQWFGDLVTMDWWDDLWLNEGFASWMEVKAVDWLYPEWGMWELFQSDDKNEALELDSLTETHPIEVPVRDPGEINEIFDAISYTKGGALLRMLEAALGEQRFQEALGTYFTRYAYANATTADLWRSLASPVFSPAGGVGAAMSVWTRTPGYPYLRVARSRDGLSFSQRPFLIRSEARRAMESRPDRPSWPLMLSVSADGVPGATPFLMTGPEGTMALPGPARAVNVNTGQTGYFRVLYEGTLREELLEALESGSLPPADRLALENDAFAFVRSGLSRMSEYLSLLARLKHEHSYGVWSDVAGNLAAIDSLWAGEPGSVAFRKWAADLVRQSFGSLGWQVAPGETHQRRLLRTTLLGLLVRFGEQETLEVAKGWFGRYLDNPESLPSDLRFSVFQAMAATGGEEAFGLLLDRAGRTVDQEEKNKLLHALGRTPGMALIDRALELTLSPLVRVQDAVSVVGAIAKNPAARRRTFDFVTGHWEEFHRRYEGGGFALNRLVRGISEEFKSAEEESTVAGFFREHPVASARRAIAQALETIRSNGEIFAANRDDFEGFFRKP